MAHDLFIKCLSTFHRCNPHGVCCLHIVVSFPQWLAWALYIMSSISSSSVIEDKCVCSEKSRNMLLFSVFFPHLKSLERGYRSPKEKRCCLHPVELVLYTEFHIKIIWETLGNMFSLSIPEIELFS